jgi:hypothetical protein
LLLRGTLSDVSDRHRLTCRVQAFGLADVHVGLELAHKKQPAAFSVTGRVICVTFALVFRASMDPAANHAFIEAAPG